MPKCSNSCNKKGCIFFKKAEIPAVVANDDITPPQNGDFCNMLVVYQATGNAYLFASDGIPTLLSANDYRRLNHLPSINGVTIVGDLTLSDIGVTQLVEEEADARRGADNDLQEQIDTIAASSDVVDIVGTYRELMQYDTSHLTINDVIKVLDDETENDATTYYRWTNDGWLFIGQEGPYYTKSQVNELLAGKLDDDALDDYYDKTETDALLTGKADVSDLAAKQDKLIAGANITIDQATNTISATVPSLANYYTKQETYSQTEVDNLISGVEADIPTATSQLTNDSGFLTTLPIATSQILGGIKVGSGLSVAPDGTLSTTGSSITVDTALSTTSTNPVENRVITNALNNKANLSDIPTVPTNVSAFYNDVGYVTSSTIAQNYYNKTETYTQTEVDNLISGVSADIPTKTSDLTNDGATGTSTYVELNQLAPVATSGSYNDLTDKPSITPELVEMSYGEANAWAKFIAAYQAKQIVYCRASSAANPASGSQTRKAFMAYVNNADSPTEVEFQYVRSVSSKTASQPVDQVFVYKLTSASGGTWTVQTRDMGPKLAQGTNTTVSYSNGTYTISATQPTVPTKTSDLTNDGSDGTSTYVEADQLAAVATSGSYNDLSNKPTIPAAQVNSDWNASSGVAKILNKPTLAAVATSGSYNDLSNKPTIPTVNNATLTIQKNGTTVNTFTANASSNVTANISVPTKTSDLMNDGLDGTSTYVEADDLAAVATSGSYNDLSNKPTIPAAQVNSDWNASSGVAQILNKPTLATVATSGSYNDLTNKPTIPVVNDAALTIQRNGVNIDSFTANASQNKSINVVVPTKTSDLTNDSNFATTSQIPTKTSDLTNDGSDGTAAYLETDETSYKTASIPYGECDSTSTATVFTATVPGITELRDGVCMWLKNGVVTSASGFTIDINGLGAKPVYNNMAAAARETTLFNVNYTFLFVYDSTRVAGGCWVLYRGWNSNDNTIGYQVRTNSQSLPMTSVVYRYRLLFTSADNEHYVPANNSTSTNATASRTVCQDKINPFGRIFYYGTTASVAADARPSATALWEQYAIALGYSFNRTGAALTLTSWKPVYVKATPQSDGSAIIDSTTPYVQDLPTTEDGKIYIFLGVAYSATNIELQLDHPVYYYKDGMIRLWTADIAVPTKTSDLTNNGADGDSPYVTEADIAPAELGGEGNAIYIEGTTDCSAIDTAILGNIEQTTYTGKNLIYIDPNFSYGITTTYNSATGAINISGTSTNSTTGSNGWANISKEIPISLPAGTYTLTRSVSRTYRTAVRLYHADNTYTQIICRPNVTTRTETIPQAIVKYYVFCDSLPDTPINDTFTLQLEQGSSATSFEKYVGGVTAPNPQFPQPVETVTGRQTVTVAGKNILDYVTYFRSGTYNGITATLNDDGSITISGKPTSNYVQIVSVHDITDLLEDGATYSLSSDGHDRRLIGQFQRRPKDGSGTQYIDTITGNKTVTIDKSHNNYYIGVMTVTTTDWGNDPLTITRTFQFEKGSVTSFEPYKGQHYEINLGKNLIEPLMPTTTYNGVTCTNNGDGSFTLNGTATATATWRIEQSTGGGHDNLKPLNGTYTLSCKGVQAGVSLVVTQFNVWQTIGKVQNNETPSTFTSNLSDTLVYIAVTNGTTVNNVTVYPQLEEGSIASPFAPYFEPIELCKIGTYQDRIYKTDGKWWLEKQTGKAAIDTSAITQIGNYSNIEYATTAKPSDFAGYGNYQNIGVLCSHAIYQDGGDSAFWNQSSNAGHIYTRADSRVFWIGFAKGTGLNAMKTALANCIIYYPLATPTTTEITNETLIRQLEALAGALGYDGVTNIISTSPGLPAILSVSTYTGSAIPSATRARAGIVRIGDGIDVDDCGTISVNAQKAPTAFTMQYADNLAGWQSGDNYELVKETTGTPTDYIYRANKFYYGGADVSFLNEKTGVVFTPQELYAWLLDGNEAVLNHVPLGWALDNGAEVLYAGNYIDGIWLKREAIASQSGNMISFNGSAFVTALIPRTSSYEETVQDTLGIAISGYEEDGAMVYDLISIDGFSLYGSVQESSPII